MKLHILSFFIFISACTSAFAQTPYDVTNSNPNGVGSLLNAIRAANSVTSSTPHIKVIVNIDPIVLDTLPRITHDVDIDLRMPNGVQAKIVRMLNTSDTTNMKYCKRPLFNFACANFTFKNADLVDSAEAPYISQVDTFIYGYQLVKTDVWNSGVYLIKNVLFKTGSNSIALEANGNYLDSTNICTIDSCFFIGGKTEVKAIYTANIMGCDFGYNRASERKGCGVLGIGVIVRANVGNSGNRRNRFTGKAVTPTEFENVIGSGEVGKLYFRNNRFDLLQQYNRSIHLVHLPDYEFGSDTAGHSNYISGVIYIETCRKGTFRNNRFGYKLAPDGVTEVPDSSNFVAGVRLVGDAFECDTSNPAMPAVTFGGRLANEPNIGCNFFIGSDVGMTKINFLGNIIRRTKPPYSPDIRVFTPTAGAPVSYICDSIAHYQVFNKVINKRPPLIESMRLVRHKTVRINVRSYVKGDTLQFFGINADSANNPAGIFALDSLITTRYVTGAVDTANGTVQSFYLPYLSIGKFGRIGIIGTYRARSSALSVARIQLCAPVSVLSGSGPGSLPAAIACANSKPGIDTIYVPSGVTISLPGSVSITDTLGLLVDSTPYSHIVPASSTAGLHAETGSNASIIRGLYFHGFTNGEDGSGLLVNDNVKGIQIDSCIFTSSDNGLSIFGDNAIIRRCKFDSSVYSGIYIGSGQNNTIKNSDFLIGNDNEGITAVNTIGLIIGGDSVSSRNTFTGEFTAVSATDSRRITIAGNRFNNFNNDYSDIIYLNNSDSILIGGDSALYGNRFSNIESYTSGIIKGSEANHIEIKANTFSGNTITNVISFSDSRYLTIGDTAIGDSAAGYTANYKAGNVFTGNTCEEVLGLSNCRDGDINYNYFGIKRTGSDATAFHNTGATIVSISSSDEGPDRDICIGSWAGEGNKIYCSPSDSIIAISASKLAKGITVAGNTVIGGAYPYYSLFTGYRHVFPPKIYILDTIAGGGVYLRYKLAYYSLLPRHKFEFFRGSTASELAYSTNTIYVGSDSGTVLIASDAKPYILFSSTNSQGSTSEYGHIRFTACPDAEPALDTLTVRFGNGGVALSDSLRISVPAGYQMRVNVQNSAGTTWDNSGKYRFSLPGTWVFKVHYNKDTGCRFVRVYTYNIPEPSAPEVFSLRNASCPGTPDGSFRFRIRYDVIDSIRTGLSRGWYTLHTFTFLGTDADYWSTYQVSGLSESGYTLNVVTKGGQVLPVVPIDILSDPVSTELISIPYAACFYGSNPGIVKFKITYPPYSDTSAHIYSKPYLIIRSDFETLYEGLGRGYDVTDSVTLTGSYFPGINLTFKASALQTSSECGSCGAEVCRSYSFFTLEKPIVKLNAINPMISGETPQFIVCGNNSTFVNFSVSEILSEIGRSTLQAQKISYTLVSGITSTTNEYVYNGWLPGLVDTSPPFLLTAGNYTLSVSVIFDSTASVGFCSSDATINFIVKPAVTAANPVVSAFPASCLDSLLSNGRAVVSAQGMDVRSYKWYQMPDSLNEMRDGKIKGSIADSLMKGAYRVVVLSYEGCTYTTDFSIDLIKGPPAPVITLYTTDSCNVYASFKDTAYGMTEQNPYGYQVYWYLDSMSNNIFVAQPYLDEASDEMRSVLPTRLLPDSGMLYAVVYNNVPCVSRVSVGALYSKPLTPRTFHICITWGKPVIPPPAVVEDIVEPPISDLSVTAINAAVAACISASKQEASRSGLSCYDPTLYADVLKYSYKEPKTISTLYYYDRAGRLVATVPPNGIDSVAAKPHSRLDRPDYKPYASTYNYNTLGQAVSQNTPDGGLTRFVYSKTGRLRLSRDAEQAIQGNYAYVKYDLAGNTIESGLAHQASAFFDFTRNSDYNYTDPFFLNDSLEDNDLQFPVFGDSTQRLEYVRNIYNDTVAGMRFRGGQQRNLANKVSMTEVFNRNGDTIRTAYSYDPHGNVEWFRQSLPGIKPVFVAYQYDLISNKVLLLSYNPEFEDRYFVRYSYDADNRLRNVESSADSLTWESDGRYTYYPHGPLSRLELGTDKVQGLDYTYTANGWLKGINGFDYSGNDDLGNDGYSTTLRDVFSMRLDYFNGDYDGNNSLNDYGYGGFGAQPSFHNLYNGNIGLETHVARDVNGTGINGIAHAYKYDKLNRLDSAGTFKPSWSTEYPVGYFSDNHWTTSAAFTSVHTYDASGNIRSVKRKDENGSMLDQLTYRYVKGSNHLHSVKDNASASAHTEDPEGYNGYAYNAIGQMIADSAHHQKLFWNAQAKPWQIKKLGGDTLVARFSYDASGNRAIDLVCGHADTVFTYNIRDLQGNVLATYERKTGVLTQTQIPLYGSDRLGVWRSARQTTDTFARAPAAQAVQLSYRLLGERDYEVKDHLGNVRAVVGDEISMLPNIYEDPASLIAQATMRSSYDYYPFGMRKRANAKKSILLNPNNNGFSGPIDPEQHFPVMHEEDIHISNSEAHITLSGYDSLAIELTSGIYTLTLTEGFPPAGWRLSYDKAYHLLSVGGENTASISFNIDTAQRIFLRTSSTATGYKAIFNITLFKFEDDVPNRYLYNGKERLSALTDVYDYGFRAYNPGIGRFFSVDPLAEKYPWYSTYQFAGNKPTWATDLDGQEELVFHYTFNNNKATLLKVECNVEFKIDGVLEKSKVVKIDKRTGKPFSPKEIGKVQYKYFDVKGKSLNLRRNYAGVYVAGANELMDRGDNNYYNSIYIGPDNPTYTNSQGKKLPDYRREPQDEADAGGLYHDLDYDKNNAVGIYGALFNKKVISADERLLKSAMETELKGMIGENDNITGKPVSRETGNRASHIISAFRLIHKIKK